MLTKISIHRAQFLDEERRRSRLVLHPVSEMDGQAVQTVMEYPKSAYSNLPTPKIGFIALKLHQQSVGYVH